MNDIDASLKVHLASRTPYLSIVSWEEQRVIAHLDQLSEALFQNTFYWTCTRSFRSKKRSANPSVEGITGALEFIGSNRDPALFVLQDFHPYLHDSKTIRTLRDLLEPLQASGSVVVFLGPVLRIPEELAKDMSVLDYPLPNTDHVRGMLAKVLRDVEENPRLSVALSPEERERLVNAALGLTESEIRNALARALVTDRSLTGSDIDVVLEEKKQIVRKSGILECLTVSEAISDIGGLENVKAWLTARQRAFSVEATTFGLPYPKGLLMLGIPGCGKSLLAKAVAREWGQPLLKLDVGRIFEGIVGSSEENVRRVLRVAEAVAPAVLWIDEIEKGFSGMQSSGDSGTSARVFSTFLSWMQEKTSPIFVIATANDISALPPELLRKGRFDEVFFVDLPTEGERECILDIHLRKRKRDPEHLKIDLGAVVKATDGFSGAELEQVIVEALYQAFSANGEITTPLLIAAARETLPLAKTMKEPIGRMREWAKARARYASNSWRDGMGQVRTGDRWAHLGDVS